MADTMATDNNGEKNEEKMYNDTTRSRPNLAQSSVADNDNEPTIQVEKTSTKDDKLEKTTTTESIIDLIFLLKFN